MSLLYNTETAVPQDVKIQKQEYQNFNLSPATYWSLSDDTQEVTDDFIVTGIYFRATAGDAALDSMGSMDVSFGDITIKGCKAESLAGLSTCDSSYCPLPNWLIKKGTIITFTLSSIAGGAAGATVTGYLL